MGQTRELTGKENQKRKNIALIIAMLQSDFSESFVEGAVKGAAETDVDLFVLPVGVIDVTYKDYLAGSYDKQYDALKEFLKSNSIDAAIVEYGSIVSLTNEEGKKAFLSAFGDIPLVLLNERAPGYDSIVIDNQEGLRELIRHVICFHKKKKIGFVSGPLNNQDAAERLKVYREVTAEYVPELGDDWIAYGNFSIYSEDVISELFTRHPDIEALICANDNMAMAAYEVLKRSGKTPGTDIIVTGFDNVRNSIMLEPQLATVDADTKMLSYRAVHYLAGTGHKEYLNDIKTHMVCRSSCGCTEGDYVFQNDKQEMKKRMQFDEKRSEFEYELSHLTSLMVDTRIAEEKRISSVLRIMKKVECASGYFYLYDRGDVQSENTEKLLLKGYYDKESTEIFKDGEVYTCADEIFAHTLLPQERQFAMLVMPLYFGRNYYGLLLAEAKVPVFHLVFQLGMQLGATFEIINMMEQMEDTKRQLVSANEAKSRFLANMSHEIRTPINAILGMNEMVLREAEEEELRSYAADIKSAGRNLLSIINDILDFSKIEAGRMELVPEEYDFGRLLREVLNMIYFRAKSKNLSVTILADENLPSKLYGDAVRIQQILLNILTNAVKYTMEGGVTFTVKGDVKGDDVCLTFIVEDTGIGIKEEDLSKLFEKFQRIEEKRNHNIEGTGLGMSITLGLLRMMGSELQVQSVYGKGTVFSFELHQRIVSGEPIGNLKKNMQDSLQERYQESFSAPAANLLVVDDNAMNRRVFKNLLKQTGVKVQEAGSGLECIRLMKREAFDIVFMDHMMPDMDGIETVSYLKEHHLVDGIPVIALTANAISGMKEMYLSNGFSDYLSKPIIPEQLEEMLVRLLPADKILYKEHDLEKEKEASESAEIPHEKMEQLEPIKELNLKYAGLFYTKKKYYYRTLVDFFHTMCVEAEKLLEFYEKIECFSGEAGGAALKELLGDYRIKVHSMKSSADLVGAVHLSGMAGVLELAAANGDRERIRALTPVFLEEWNYLYDKLYPVLKEKRERKQPGAPEFKPEVLAAELDRLAEAISDMDVDTADAIVAGIRTYDVPAELEELLDCICTAVYNLSVEDVKLYAERIKEKMAGNEE